MDFTKFFAGVVQRRKESMIRKFAEAFMATPNSINLANGMPNSSMFPFEEISMTFKDGTKKVLRDRELSTSLQYGPSKGFTPLVKRMREFQSEKHGSPNINWDIAFTNGSMDGCSKIFEMLIENGEPVLIQTPTYTGTINAIAPLLPDFIGIEQDQDGIIPEIIENVCEERLRSGKPMPKLLYVNPTGANPTGTVLSLDRRHRIYKLAQRYDFLIVEDDPYYFIHFLNEPPPSFFSMDTDARVLRLDSFSKIMSAGIRLGVVTAHKDVINKLILQIESSVMHSSSLSQMLLYKLFESWTPQKFDEHFKEIQSFYRQRRDIMLAAVEKHFTGLAEWTVPKGGMFIWVKVTAIGDVLELTTNECISNGVFVLPGHAFEFDQNKDNRHLRLSYSYATPQQIDKALAIIANLIREKAAKKSKSESK